jgi:hypothetical protein
MGGEGSLGRQMTSACFKFRFVSSPLLDPNKFGGAIRRSDYGVRGSRAIFDEL